MVNLNKILILVGRGLVEIDYSICQLHFTCGESYIFIVVLKHLLLLYSLVTLITCETNVFAASSIFMFSLADVSYHAEK